MQILQIINVCKSMQILQIIVKSTDKQERSKSMSKQWLW